MPFLLAINIAMDNLYYYCGYTLIDITKTNVTTYSAEFEKQRNQQRNWETVNQLLSLRSQLFELKHEDPTEVNLRDYSFGINYTGLHKVWQIEFAVEYENIFAFDQDRYGTLKDDFKIAPIILGLDETAKPPLPLFYASGPDKNIYFKSIQK